MKILKINYYFEMKGQSMIEVLVALGIISIVLIYISTIITGSITNAQFANDKNTADSYASEGMEIVRNVRDQDVTAFKTYNGVYCLDKNKTTLDTVQASCTTENVDKFIRQIQIEQSPGCDVNTAKIKVQVSWSDGKCASGNKYCHIEKLESCLSTVSSLNAP